MVGKSRCWRSSTTRSSGFCGRSRVAGDNAPAMRYWLLAAAFLSASVAITAQTGPRTPWGDPDLQGIWPSGALITVPFERPPEFGTRAVLTDKEYAERATALQQQAEDDAAPISTGTAPSVNPPSHWL